MPPAEVKKGAPEVSVEISGFRIRNPTILASGIIGVTIPLLKRVADAGSGGVVSKSIGVEPREGYVNPTIVEVEGGYVNAVGLSNPGVKEFVDELSEYGYKDLPLIVSLFGGRPEEFSRMASMLNRREVKAFELNLSCPHVERVGLEVGEDAELVSKIIRAVKENSRKPVFVKVSPNASDVVEGAKVAEDSGADAITAVNTVRAMVIDIETGRPILSNRIGGLSGPSIKPIALRCVYEISRSVKIPVIGCGGILDWQDAVEFFLAGASAVQIGTALAYKDLSIFKEIVEGVKGYLLRKGRRSLREIVGSSHAF